MGLSESGFPLLVQAQRESEQIVLFVLFPPTPAEHQSRAEVFEIH